jgi:hypothetical protein
MVILHTIIWKILDYFYLTKASNGDIIIKLSTRETVKSTKERRKLRDKRTNGRVVQKTGTLRSSKKILQKYLTNE